MDPFAENNSLPAGGAGYNPYARQSGGGNQQQPQHHHDVNREDFFDSNNSANANAYGQGNVAYNPNSMSNQQQPPQFQQPQHAAPPTQPNITGPYKPPQPGSTKPSGSAQQPPLQEDHKPVEPTSKFWTIQFYQQFFDVDTRQVLLRMGNTMVPITSPDFLVDLGWHYNRSNAEGAPQAAAAAGAAAGGANFTPTESNMFTSGGVLLNKAPDLYGPVWICTTLWMLMGIVGNLLSKIQNHRENARNKLIADTNHTPYTEKIWNYDFTQASIACATVYAYVVLMGLAVWGIMKWKELPVGLPHVICTFGYAMFVFILTCILCAIPITAIQWLVVMLGFIWSIGYILVNFWYVWRNSLAKAWFYGVVIFVATMHMGLALSFKFYFFNYAL